MRSSPLLPGLVSVFTVICLGSAGAPAAAEPNVVASIKPVHSLAAGVMEGVASTPTLLVEGAGSEHSYALRPSDARALNEANLVFWVGEQLETYLTEPLAELADDAEVVALAGAAGMRLLAPRRGGAWDAHVHADEGDDHGHNHEAAEDHDHHAPYDPHLWLDPQNARRIVAVMVEELSEHDPANAATYRANGDRLAERLESLDRDLAAMLAPVKDAPYIVFHDAYQYFEARYDLAAAGSITVGPERQPGAQRLRRIREKILRLNVRCVFSEPQFEPALVDTLREGTPARTGELDPLGANLPNGPDLYFEMMGNLARSLKGCLSEGS